MSTSTMQARDIQPGTITTLGTVLKIDRSVLPNSSASNPDRPEPQAAVGYLLHLDDGSVAGPMAGSDELEIYTGESLAHLVRDTANGLSSSMTRALDLMTTRPKGYGSAYSVRTPTLKALTTRSLVTGMDDPYPTVLGYLVAARPVGVDLNPLYYGSPEAIAAIQGELSDPWALAVICIRVMRSSYGDHSRYGRRDAMVACIVVSLAQTLTRSGQDQDQAPVAGSSLKVPSSLLSRSVSGVQGSDSPTASSDPEGSSGTCMRCGGSARPLVKGSEFRPGQPAMKDRLFCSDCGALQPVTPSDTTLPPAGTISDHPHDRPYPQGLGMVMSTFDRERAVSRMENTEHARVIRILHDDLSMRPTVTYVVLIPTETTTIEQIGLCGCTGQELEAGRTCGQEDCPNQTDRKDTSEDLCSEHGFEICPDCGNGGVKIGTEGYEDCTRFIGCWSDPDRGNTSEDQICQRCGNTACEGDGSCGPHLDDLAAEVSSAPVEEACSAPLGRYPDGVARDPYTANLTDADLHHVIARVGSLSPGGKTAMAEIAWRAAQFPTLASGTRVQHIATPAMIGTVESSRTMDHATDARHVELLVRWDDGDQPLSGQVSRVGIQSVRAIETNVDGLSLLDQAAEALEELAEELAAERGDGEGADIEAAQKLAQQIRERHSDGPHLSSDERVIAEAIKAHERGELISDLQARVIAAAWHGGQDSALYALTSTGSILDGGGDSSGRHTQDEIIREISQHHDDASELRALLAYVEEKDVRGPIEGWSSLTW